MHRRRGTHVETQIVTAGYGVMLALLFPRFFPHYPLGLALLWLAGLGIAKLFCSLMLGEPPAFWRVLLVFVSLTVVPALSLYGGFPPGCLFLVAQPYLTVRILLRWPQD